MIRNIEFKDADGYLTSTIDNETLPLPLKEIIKKEVYIENRAFTSVPLYEKIPINFIFTTEDNLPVDKGEINISIVSKDENGNIIKEYYNKETAFKDNKYQDDIKIDIPLGVYYVTVTYKGSKYYQPTSLSYLLTIEPRKVLYDLETDEYYGNPSETIDIKFRIQDNITKQGLSNFIVYYKYENDTYITKSDIDGYVRMQAIIPEPGEFCPNSDNRTYTIEIYIDNDAYYSSNTEIYLHNNKLKTQISFYSEIDENNVNIHGIITADNYDDIVNIRNGRAVLSVDGEEYSDFNFKVQNNGAFTFNINMQDIEETYENLIDYRIKNYAEKVDAYMTISNVSDINAQNKINPVVTIKDKFQQPIVYGMISIALRKDGITLQNRIIEVNNEGSANAEFFMSTKGDYTIRCKYHPMFEYQDKEESHIVNFKVK